jgi:hypothetical protein
MIIHGSRHRNVKRNRGRSNNSGGEREGEEGAGAEQMSDEGTRWRRKDNGKQNLGGGGQKLSGRHPLKEGTTLGFKKSHRVVRGIYHQRRHRAAPSIKAPKEASSRGGVETNNVQKNGG